MRGKIAALAMVVAAVLSLGFSTAASAHEPVYHGSSHGWGRPEVRPHWHTYYTPYGAYSYYGIGRHDYFVPRDHYYPPYYRPYATYYGYPSYYYQR